MEISRKKIKQIFLYATGSVALLMGILIFLVKETSSIKRSEPSNYSTLVDLQDPVKQEIYSRYFDHLDKVVIPVPFDIKTISEDMKKILASSVNKSMEETSVDIPRIQKLAKEKTVNFRYLNNATVHLDDKDINLCLITLSNKDLFVSRNKITIRYPIIFLTYHELGHCYLRASKKDKEILPEISNNLVDPSTYRLFDFIQDKKERLLARDTYINMHNEAFSDLSSVFYLMKDEDNDNWVDYISKIRTSALLSHNGLLHWSSPLLISAKQSLIDSKNNNPNENHWKEVTRIFNLHSKSLPSVDEFLRIYKQISLVEKSRFPADYSSVINDKKYKRISGFIANN